MTTEPMQKALSVLEAHPPTLAQSDQRKTAFLDIAAFLEQSTRPGCPYDLY